MPYQNQARDLFDCKKLDELAQSIKIYGIRQPLIVQKNNDETYSIISGERRFRAAQKLGLKELGCIILDNNDLPSVDEIALAENIHREDLSLLELYKGYKILMDSKKYTNISELASALGKNRTHVSEVLSYETFSYTNHKDQDHTEHIECRIKN